MSASELNIMMSDRATHHHEFEILMQMLNRVIGAEGLICILLLGILVMIVITNSHEK